MAEDFKVDRSTDKYLPHRYAGASGDFNPIHIDPEFAKAVGFERNILHGLSTMAFIAKSCSDQVAGDPRKLKRLKVRFASPVLVEQTVTITGQSTGTKEGVATYGIEAVNSKGETVISNAVAELEQG